MKFLERFDTGIVKKVRKFQYWVKKFLVIKTCTPQTISGVCSGRGDKVPQLFSSRQILGKIGSPKTKIQYLF